MQLIYNCLVQPYFDYCSVVWDSCGSTLNCGKTTKTAKSFRKGADIFNIYDINADHLFEILGWKNLASQRKIAKTIMVYKS